MNTKKLSTLSPRSRLAAKRVAGEAGSPRFAGEAGNSPPATLCVAMRAGQLSTSQGFTIVETIVTISIIAVIAIVLTNLLTYSLRSEGKAALIGEVKHNGQFALSQIEKAIRDADRVVCINSTTEGVLVVAKEGEYVRFSFINPYPAATPTENGFIAKDLPIDQATACAVSGKGDLLGDYISLTNNIDLVNGVSIFDGKFNRSTKPGFKDEIAVEFKVFPAVKSGATAESSLGSDGVTFRTTVGMR